MDLTSVLLRMAARRPHLLVVPSVDGTAVRLAVEASVARRGWPVATGPADADVVVVAGSPGPELEAVIERIWQQVPKPHARVSASEAADVDRQLDAAVALLADRDHQAAPGPGEEASRAASGGATTGRGHHDHARHPEHDGHSAHEGHPEQGLHAVGEHGGHSAHDGDGDGDHGGSPPSAHADSGHAHQGHEDSSGHDDHEEGHRDDAGHQGHGSHHGHHGHGGGMELPGGLPMADLAEDRDGLTLDRLRVPLGPVLPDWPAGLVVRVTLHGDVIQQAAAEVLDHRPGEGFWQWVDNAAARELDGLARFLGVAGWTDVSEQARRLRDDLLVGGPTEQTTGAVSALVHRVRRSRTLRWLVRGIPAGATDVAALLDRRLTSVESALASGGAPRNSRPSLDELAGLLVGAEFAAARLLVAAFDPDTEQVPAQRQARHG